MEELWKPIPEYIGYYEASNLGNIRSVDRGVLTSSGRIIHLKSVVLKPHEQYRSLRGKKYFCGYQVALTKNGKHKSWLVHKLVCKAWHSLMPINATQVNHKDGNRRNNKADNLEWVSAQENIVHGYDNGLFRNRATKVVVKNIDTNERLTFMSCLRLSDFLGKSRTYVKSHLQEGELLESANDSHLYEVLFVDKEKKGDRLVPRTYKSS